VKELVDVAHQHGIKILLDFVSNHVHEQHPYYKEHPEWFGQLELSDGSLNLRLWDEQRLTTWFEPYMPSFDYLSSQEALDTMTSNAVWWLKSTGADGYRHDAVKHVPNKFWRELTRKMKAEVEPSTGNHVYQIGETFGGYDLVSSYVNNGQLDAQFAFNLYNVAQTVFIDPRSSFASLDQELIKNFQVYGYNHIMGNIMDSHDKNRFMAYTDGDLELSQWSAIEEGWNNPPKVDNPSSYNKAILYLAYMNAIPGLPVIYYGSEFGMTGASDPDNRRMMRFDNQLDENEKLMLGKVQQIINIRKNHSALRYGDYYKLIADENIFVFIRSDLNERVLIILNKSDEERSVNIKLPEFYKSTKLLDLISKDKLDIKDSRGVLSVYPIGYRFLVLK
jgi:glycosidase